MEAPTPTFCKDFASKRLKKHNNFSNACEKVNKIKPKGKKSCMNLNKLDNKLKKEKDQKIKKTSHKRHHSQKFKLREYEDIGEVDDNKSHHKKSKKKNIINNIHDFIKKHKFKLRNDFDRKHSEQFFLSKEAAFEKPFSLSEEIVIEKNRNFVFTLKND